MCHVQFAMTINYFIFLSHRHGRTISCSGTLQIMAASTSCAYLRIVFGSQTSSSLTSKSMASPLIAPFPINISSVSNAFVQQHSQTNNVILNVNFILISVNLTCPWNLTIVQFSLQNYCRLVCSFHQHYEIPLGKLSIKSVTNEAVTLSELCRLTAETGNSIFPRVPPACLAAKVDMEDILA